MRLHAGRVPQQTKWTRLIDRFVSDVDIAMSAGDDRGTHRKSGVNQYSLAENHAAGIFLNVGGGSANRRALALVEAGDGTRALAAFRRAGTRAVAG
jgi:hypothetical protein